LEQHPVEIRPATEMDALGVSQCVQSAYEHYIPIIGMKPNPMLDDYHVVIEQKQVSVLTFADQIIGVVVLEETDEGFLLNNVAITPRYQDKGFGSLLLQFAEKEAMRQGYSAIYLYTNAKMMDNQAIYAARGYVEYERRKVNGRDGVFMRKDLAGINV
jgi:N-acetylglutamate synthase-like GNAT family acetyltransferase